MSAKPRLAVVVDPRILGVHAGEYVKEFSLAIRGQIYIIAYTAYHSLASYGTSQSWLGCRFTYQDHMHQGACMPSAFTLRLHTLGFSSYQGYLASPHWQAIKSAYRKNRKLPQYCIGCRNEHFELHHRSYARLGHETIGDLIALCRECHSKVHEYMTSHHIPLVCTHVALRRVLHLTKGQMKRRFRPFSQRRGMAFARDEHGPRIQIPPESV